MGKSRFLIENSWGDMFLGLSDVNAGKLIKAMYAHQRGEDAVLDDPVLDAVFQMVKSTMNENEEAYQKECEKRKHAAKERWKKKEKEEVNDDASACTCIEDNAHASTCMQVDGDMTCSYHIISSQDNNNISKPKDNIKHKHGEYNNVLLTDTELEKLKSDYPDWEQRIDRLSGYIASKGAKYKSHYATIKNWARRDEVARSGTISVAEKWLEERGKK